MRAEATCGCGGDSSVPTCSHAGRVLTCSYVILGYFFFSDGDMLGADGRDDSAGGGGGAVAPWFRVASFTRICYVRAGAYCIHTVHLDGGYR